jgi:hypothetical protein
MAFVKIFAFSDGHVAASSALRGRRTGCLRRELILSIFDENDGGTIAIVLFVASL